MGKLRLVTCSRSPSLSVGMGVGHVAPAGAPGPGLLGPREGETGLQVLDGPLWGLAMSPLEALPWWDPTPGCLCCRHLGERLVAGPGPQAPVGCPRFFELLRGRGCLLPSCGQPCGPVVDSGPGQRLTRASSHHGGALERRVRWLVSVGECCHTAPTPDCALTLASVPESLPPRTGAAPECPGLKDAAEARIPRRRGLTVWWRGRGVVEGLWGGGSVTTNALKSCAGVQHTRGFPKRETEVW